MPYFSQVICQDVFCRFIPLPPKDPTLETDKTPEVQQALVQPFQVILVRFQVVVDAGSHVPAGMIMLSIGSTLGCLLDTFESSDTLIKSHLPRLMVVWVQFADLFPINTDSFAKSSELELGVKILRIISDDFAVVRIPSTPGVHEVTRRCIHGFGKCAMSNLLQQCERVELF
jgi:hypothetical protein